MKITEALKKDTGKITLVAYVNESGELASILDRTQREANEALLDELFDKKAMNSTEEIDKRIKELEKEIDKIVPFEFELSEPTFDVVSSSLSAIYVEGGSVDTMASGKVVFDACYQGNQGSLEEIQGFTTLYTSLCSKCYHSIVEIADIEYKKK